jgi:hypothetical protein
MPSRLRHHLLKQLFLPLFACGTEQNIRLSPLLFIVNIAFVELVPALLNVATLAYIRLQVFGRVAALYAACADERPRILRTSAVLELILSPALLRGLLPALADVAPRVRCLTVQATQRWFRGLLRRTLREILYLHIFEACPAFLHLADVTRVNVPICRGHAFRCAGFADQAVTTMPVLLDSVVVPRRLWHRVIAVFTLDGAAFRTSPGIHWLSGLSTQLCD